MTEIPEHLLARSKARRSGLAGGGGESAAPVAAAASAPAATEAAAPAPVEAAAPKPPAPKLPWVEASEKRRRIPMWAMGALVALPIWAIMYATTNDPQSPKTAGPLTTGATVYSTCAACHGAAGGGGVGPAFAGGAILKTFPEPAAQLRWVMLGTAGYTAEGTTTYGATNKPVGEAGKNMPAQVDGLTSDQLLSVVRHERETIGGEKFDATKWDTVADTLMKDKNPKVAEKAKEFKAIIDSWKTLPAGS